MPSVALSAPRRWLLLSRCRASLARCSLGLAYWSAFERLWGASRKNALTAARARGKSRERMDSLLQRRDDARAALGLLRESKSPFFHL